MKTLNKVQMWVAAGMWVGAVVSLVCGMWWLSVAMSANATFLVVNSWEE